MWSSHLFIPFQAKQLQPKEMKKYKLGSNLVNYVNSVRVIFAGSGEFDLTPLDVGVNAHFGVN